MNAKFDESRTDANRQFTELREEMNRRQEENNRRFNNLQTLMIIGGITILGAVIGLSFT